LETVAGVVAAEEEEEVGREEEVGATAEAKGTRPRSE
jgi:hypothetical protein